MPANSVRQKRQVSGRELFYLAPCVGGGRPDQTTAPQRCMVSVAFEAGSSPRIETPRELFAIEPGLLGVPCAPARCYDVSPDGQRCFVSRSLPSPATPPVTHVNLVLNWFEELKAKAPATR